jgi:hypothetical protein
MRSSGNPQGSAERLMRVRLAVSMLQRQKVPLAGPDCEERNTEASYVPPVPTVTGTSWKTEPPCCGWPS